MRLFKLFVGALFIVLLTGSLFVFYKISSNNLPKTIPNTNEKPIGSLSLVEGELTNRWGEAKLVEFGQLIVPENRASKTTNHIGLSFIRIPTKNSNPFPPIFFLAGGPGTPGSNIAKSSYFYLFRKISEYMDVVILDQRGTGQSIPNLTCRNNLSLPVDITRNVEDQLLKDILKKCGECADEFKEMNIDLASYNSIESSNDIDQIRAALNYDSISLYGYSYGTTLSQHYMEMYEQNVYRVVLAGPTAPDLGLKLPSEVQNQFFEMDSLIIQDKKLNKYITGLPALMKEVHDKLDKNPELIKIPLMDAVSDNDGFLPTTIFKTISLFKPYWKLTLTEEHLQMMTAQNVGYDFWISRFPAFYYQMSKGNYRDAGNILRNFRRQPLPNAIFFTVTSATGYDQQRWKDAEQDQTVELLSHFSISFGRFPEISKKFSVVKQEGFNQPVRSDLEVLLIAGSLDGRTPIYNKDSLSNRFSNHKTILVKNAGHNNLIDNKIMGKVIDFFTGKMIQNDTIFRRVEFIPPIPYLMSLADTLESERINKDINSALSRYQSIYKKYKDQEDYLYDLSENSLNNYGYQLINKNQINDALEIFKLNAEIFPERFNVFNSLGEAYLNQGDTLAARKCFKKAIDLNYFDAYSQSILTQIK